MLNKKKNISIFKYISFLICLIFYFIIYIHFNYNDSRNNYIKAIKNESIYQEFLNVENYNTEFLVPIRKDLNGFIEISYNEQRFLNGIIRKIKPKKIVEIGVAYGGTAALMLNAIRDIENAKLYSIDININCYRIPTKKTGFLVNEKFPYLADKWKLYTGGYTSEFIEKIGNNIDLVYIDTIHVTPGEMLNWLEILPFLKEEAFVVLHDIYYGLNKRTISKNNINYSNNQILTYIRGKLILPSYYPNTFSRNIGAIKLSKNQENYYLQYFLALGNKWQYLPSERELNILNKFFRKYYGIKYTKIFIDAIEKNKLIIKK